MDIYDNRGTLYFSIYRVLESDVEGYDHQIVRKLPTLTASGERRLLSSPELSVLSSQHKQFEPPGWFTKTAPIADRFLLPL